MSFDEVRDSLVISFAEGLITEEEFLFLYEEYESVNPFYSYWEFEPLCLDSLDSSECKCEFRLEKEDIPFYGTVRGICRPETNQRVVYNGHKRVHGLKFQSVALPNNLIGNLYGPVEGHRHDARMLKDSGPLKDLSRVGFNTRGEVLFLYGDPAYPLRPNLMRPYCQGDVPVLTPEMEAFNTAMSSLRVSVEWLFNDVSNYFKFIDFKKNLKIGMSAVGKQYIVCALLRNVLTCLYGNITSDHFQLEPPTVQDYLA
ncbi:unnamed protein product [Porites evermanni]|uniref:DDE Tnp4 domain-containing protein n=1 Tax=Porites evermanni TaxID=104178 RepID=A0ABN8M2S7_9CNID|nr:unnamed protein product [Porites evermanni]